MFELFSKGRYPQRIICTVVAVARYDAKKGNTMMFFQHANGFDNITPAQLAELRETGEEFFLLDVRTPLENAGDAINGSYLIPIQELGHRLDELPKDRDIVVYCRIGTRSAYACMHLARLGYRVRNLEGGIALWNMAGKGRSSQGHAFARGTR